MGENRTRKSPLEFIDSKTVMLSLDEDFCDFLEARPQPSESAEGEGAGRGLAGRDLADGDLADRHRDAERKLADISMALHQLLGLKAN